MWPFGRRPDRAAASETESEELARTRLVELTGPISDEMAVRVIAQLLFLQFRDPRRPITLRIDSPGGGMHAGLAVVDTLRDLEPAVHTEAPRAAQAMAAVVLAAGRCGHRTVGPEAELSLEPLFAVDTEPTDRLLSESRGALADLLTTLTGQPREAVLHDLLVGRRFTPAEAVAFGLADRVTS